MGARNARQAVQVVRSLRQQAVVGGQWFDDDRRDLAAVTLKQRLDRTLIVEGRDQRFLYDVRSEPGAVRLRRIGEPDDIGGIAVFLASRAAAFITGQTIVADGGVTIAG